MPGFKDFLKKAGEMAKKGLEMIQEQMASEQMIRDFDEYVANQLVEVMSSRGYRPLRQYEQDNYYIVEFGADDLDKVKHHIERYIMRKYSPKDREKILQVIPDSVVFHINFTRKTANTTQLLLRPNTEDTILSARLKAFIERKGGFFSKVKRDNIVIDLGRISFKSSDFINYDEKVIDNEKLRNYLKSKIKA